MLKLKLELGKRPRGGPKRSFMDVLKDEMKVVEVRRMQSREFDGGRIFALVTP